VHVEQEPSSSTAWIAWALAFPLVLSAVLGLGRKRE
jgi:hypothetical protein